MELQEIIYEKKEQLEEIDWCKKDFEKELKREMRLRKPDLQRTVKILGGSVEPKDTKMILAIKSIWLTFGEMYTRKGFDMYRHVWEWKWKFGNGKLNGFGWEIFLVKPNSLKDYGVVI